jgi:uncharacterized protein YceH (UPF0502 family)
MQSEMPFIAQMERKTGQKEARYYHLFAPFVEPEETGLAATSNGKIQELEERLSTLEEQVAAIKKVIDELMN